ncbi:PadR family transcriptional regulator [Micromonospora endolithica]|uniref:PadR family transcriptional regulator n=1 Tax=Micromonospora endolithica TaxID=230091 RepID=A0A3A9ZAH5_9ACTN|nr:PadR family transcriptional regulator [Micromonospora endolithica]RKN45313.1 PadR family transcriptional regulator [Micromonospora endolithica]TWJ22994.1 PadR family transcriptional regulator PadR [Micromonospora endolithica]
MVAPGDQPTDEGDRQTQLLRGALDMCLLALLAREPAHGYELVRRMEAAGFGAISYGTIYPLLTRMRRLGLVADEQQVSPTGPPRKVYALTGSGRTHLDAWQKQWTRFAGIVDAVLIPPADRTTRS